MRWLLENQEPDGSWFGRWGANHVYGTGATVPALVAAGVVRGASGAAAGHRWLLEHQNPDGGWGEDLRSYEDPAWIGRGESTASQTAWALLALLAVAETPLADIAQVPSIDRGVLYLTGPSAPTAPGTRTCSPEPASPATSTSTTTCTGLSFR